MATVSKNPTDLNFFSRGGGTTFPLYILRNGTEVMFFKGKDNMVSEPETYYEKDNIEWLNDYSNFKKQRNQEFPKENKGIIQTSLF